VAVLRVGKVRWKPAVHVSEHAIVSFNDLVGAGEEAFRAGPHAARVTSCRCG
jgi:hypothetical protein